MKKQYMRQVGKRLHLSRKEKAEVLRDLSEIFASALEHGETEQQVIARLGTPEDFADSTAVQFGVDNVRVQQRKGILSSVAAIILAVASFAVFATATIGKMPKNAIGQADATTNMHITGAFGFDMLQIIFVAGVIAAAFAVIQIIRTARAHGRQP